MAPAFHPRLINDPFDDPGLFVPFQFEKRALLFDLGEIHPLSPRDVLKISHIFITHTHMDHFSGFDRVLRLMLGRDKDLHLYGPAGFLKNIEGKLAGYSWNLVKGYENRFNLHAFEINPDKILSKTYACNKGFVSDQSCKIQPFTGIIHAEPSFEIHCRILDHGIPCLGFCLKERFHINIIKERLEEMRLKSGPWLNKFKHAMYENHDPESPFEVPPAGEGEKSRWFRLGELSEKIALTTRGQHIAYFADVAYSSENEKKIIELSKDATHLFIEAAFLDMHKKDAERKKHLTARQAGILAAKAGAGQFSLFHHSPRYNCNSTLLEKEAGDAFMKESV